MTEKIYRAKAPLYGSPLYLVVVDNVPEYYKKHIGDCDDSRNCVAFTAIIKGKLCIVIPPTVSIGTLAHEAIHAAADILKLHGSKWGRKNEEPLCYLAGWITDWVFRVVRVPKNNEK